MFLGTKNRTLYYVHEGCVYVLHVCIVVVVVGKSNKKDDRIIMRSRDVFKHCGFISFSNWCWLSEALLNHRIF
jgi:hypothetical protein